MCYFFLRGRNVNFFFNGRFDQLMENDLLKEKKGDVSGSETTLNIFCSYNFRIMEMFYI